MSQTKLILSMAVPEYQLRIARYEPVYQRKKFEDPADEPWHLVESKLRPTGETADMWDLRNQFLECPIEEWLQFLERVGPFIYDETYSLRMNRITQNEFAEWQKFITKALDAPWAEWPSLEDKMPSNTIVRLIGQLPVDVFKRFDGDRPVATVARPGSAIDAIRCSLLLDALQGVKTRVCALDGCFRRFQIKAHDTKVYCSAPHAHLAAVRRSREKIAGKSRKTVQRKKGSK